MVHAAAVIHGLLEVVHPGKVQVACPSCTGETDVCCLLLLPAAACCCLLQHGTHCAGTVGGARYGVAKGVNLVSRMGPYSIETCMTRLSIGRLILSSPPPPTV